MTQLPTLTVAANAKAIDSARIQATLADESKVISGDSIKRNYPKLHNCLGDNIKMIDSGFALTDITLTALNELCTEGAIDNDFLGSLFQKRVINYLAPIKDPEKAKNIIRYLMDKGAAVDFLAALDKPPERNNLLMAARQNIKICVQVFIMALYQFSPKSDKVFTTILDSILADEQLKDNFENRPVSFVIIALASNEATRDILVNIHDKSTTIEEREDRLKTKIEKLSQSNTREKSQGLRKIIKQQMKRYWPPLVEKDAVLECVADHIVYAMKYQRKLSYALYGLNSPEFSDYTHNRNDHRERIQKMNNTLIESTNIDEYKKLGLLLALIEYPNMMEYLYKSWLNHKNETHTTQVAPYIMKAFNQSIGFTSSWVAESVPKLNGDPSLAHTVFFSILEAHITIFRYEHETDESSEALEDTGWLSGFIRKYTDIKVFSNVNGIANKLRSCWLGKHHSEPAEPQTDQEWNEFYGKLAVAILPAYVVSPDAVKNTKKPPPARPKAASRQPNQEALTRRFARTSIDTRPNVSPPPRRQVETNRRRRQPAETEQKPPAQTGSQRGWFDWLGGGK